jgi:hypothetical protein
MRFAHFSPAVLAAAILLVGCATGSDSKAVTEPAEVTAAAVTTAVAAAAQPSTAEPIRDEAALEVIDRFSDFLDAQQTMRLTLLDSIDEWDERGLLVQRHHRRELFVQRPDKLRIDVQGDLETERAIFDGKTFTFFLPKENAVGRIDAPGSIDELLDLLANDYGIRRPTLELAHTGIAARVRERAASVHYVGLASVNGNFAHQILIEGERASYQLWIAADGDPILRRMVVRYKTLEGQPRYTMTVVGTRFGEPFGEDAFTMTIPEGASVLPMQKLP